MATKYIERNTSFPGAVGDTPSTVVPVFHNSTIERPQFYDRTAAIWRTVENGVKSVITPTAAFALTAAQSGSDVMLNAAAGFAITLPAAAPGLNYRFTVAAAFATTDFTIITPGLVDIIFGQAMVVGALVAASAEDTISFVASAELPGDYCEVWSDGTSWFVSGMCVTTGGLTFTQAG